MSTPLSFRPFLKADGKNDAFSGYAGVSGCADVSWRAEITTICSVQLDACLDGHVIAVNFVACLWSI